MRESAGLRSAKEHMCPIIGDVAKSMSGKAAPTDVQQGKWCPHCYGNARLTKADLDDLAAAHGGKCLSETCQGSRVHHEWECVKGHQWQAMPTNVQRGKWCPHCAKRHSKPEIRIFKAIQVSYPDALHGKRGFLKTRKFQLDIFIPSLQKAIEYDGTYWHSRSGSQERDARKDRECQEANIQLLRIKEANYLQDPTGTIAEILEWLQK